MDKKLKPRKLNVELRHNGLDEYYRILLSRSEQMHV